MKSAIKTPAALDTSRVCNSRILANVNTLGDRRAAGFVSNEPGGGILVPGTIYLANEARFVEAHFSEPLTTYAVGWKDPNDIEATLEFFAPKVQTSARFEYAEAVNAEEFLQEGVSDEDVRAILGDFKRVEYTGKKTLGKTKNKGLTIRVDLDQVQDQPNWQEMKTGKLMRRLYRSELYRSIAKLSAAATNAAKTWSSGSPQPDGDVRTQLLTATTSSGIRPNRVGYGDTAWDTRIGAYEGQNNAGAYAALQRDMARLASYLMVDQCLVSRERYQSSATAKTEIVAALVLLFNALGGADNEDPSNIKRFISPVEGGGNFRVYVQQVSSKLVDITVEHNSDIIITSTLGLRKVTVS